MDVWMLESGSVGYGSIMCTLHQLPTATIIRSDTITTIIRSDNSADQNVLFNVTDQVLNKHTEPELLYHESLETIVELFSV